MLQSKQSTSFKTTQNTAKQNYPGSVAFYYDTRPRNKLGLFYNAPEARWGRNWTTTPNKL